MKKRIISLMLSVAVVFSCFPLFTLQADAFSTGAKYLLKTRTVTIKPGKTYKSPKFRASSKMTFQVPVKIRLGGKTNTGKYYNLSYALTLKTSGGTKKATFKQDPIRYFDSVGSDIIYDDWVYFYKTKTNPCFAKGRYYFTIKNTSKRTLKFKYCVKGYTKFATKAEFKKTITANADVNSIKAGNIGPGLPAIKSIKSSNDDVYFDWFISAGGVLRLYPDIYDNSKDMKTTVTVTLMSGKKYTIKINFKAV